MKMDVNHFLTDVFLGTNKTHEPDTHTHIGVDSYENGCKSLSHGCIPGH